MISYVFSQISIVLALLCLAISYNIKNYKYITLLNIFSCIFFGLSYGLLGAFTAIGLNIVGAISYICFYIFKINNKENPLYFIILMWVATIINAILTYMGAVSLIPTFASLIFFYSVWQKNNLVYRYSGILTAILYAIYNLVYLSVFGVICQLCLMVIGVIGVIRYYKLKKTTEIKE